MSKVEGNEECFENEEEEDVVEAVEDQDVGTVDADTVRSKWWTWEEGIHRGDCTIHIGNKLKIFSDGTWRWDCQVSSTDTNDTWELQFKIKDKNKDVLFWLPPDTERKLVKDMPEGTPAIDWNIDSGSMGTFPSQLYDAAHFAQPVCDC